MFYHFYEKIVNTSVHFINKLLLVWPITQTFISNVVTDYCSMFKEDVPLAKQGKNLFKQRYLLCKWILISLFKSFFLIVDSFEGHFSSRETIQQRVESVSTKFVNFIKKPHNFYG